MKYKEFAKLLPGEEAVLDIDMCVLNDNLSLETIQMLQQKKAYDSSKILINIDQIVPPNSAEQSAIGRQLMKLAKDQGIIINQGNSMTSHYLCDGSVSPDQIVAVAGNSTVAAVGAVGAYGINLEEKQIAEVFETGQIRLQAPKQINISLKGVLPVTCTSKDVAMKIISQTGTVNLEGKVVCIHCDEEPEFICSELMDINILLAAAGAVTVIETAEAVMNGEEICIDLSSMTAMAAPANSYERICNVATMEPIPVKVVYIGGSSGGNFTDIKIIADAVRGGQIAYGLRLAVAPATSEIYRQIADAGYIKDILDAGGIVLNQCADADIQCRIGPNENMVSNDWKNAVGYAGYSSSQVIIASTISAAKAALEGVIGSDLKPETTAEQSQDSIILEGRCWKFGDDIDTDIIIPTQYVTIPYEEMLRYAFAPLRPGLAELFEEGDIIVAGDNFGCGSSREMAAEVIAGNGIKCIIAKSFARIFFRNAINNGILLIECPELPDEVEEGSMVRVELNRQIICNNKSYPIGKIMDNLYEIIADGGLVKNIEKKVRLGLL